MAESVPFNYLKKSSSRGCLVVASTVNMLASFISRKKMYAASGSVSRLNSTDGTLKAQDSKVPAMQYHLLILLANYVSKVNARAMFVIGPSTKTPKSL